MKKLLKVLACVILASLFFVYLAATACRMPMNSDCATMLLYADEVLSGNVFLSGWSLSGLTFFTTDLPFYIIGVFVFGVSLKAYHLSIFLMYAFMAFSAVLAALSGIRHKWTALVLFASIGLIPTTYALSNTFVHTGVFGLFFLAAFALLRYERTASYLSLFALFIITVLGVSGDTMAVVLITIPVIILCFTKIFKKAYLPALTVILASFAGVFLQKVFLHLGGADLNSLNHRHFIASSEIYNSIIRYAEYFLKLLNSYFFTKPVFSAKTLVFGIQIVIALFAIYIIISSLKAAFTKKETDAGICITGLSLSVVSLVLVLTTLNANITAGRYIGFMPMVLGIALARCTDIFLPLEKIKTKAVVWLLCTALVSAGVISSIGGVSPINTHSRLADFLLENNLTDGYASFWDASVITGYSENKVKVRSVTFEDGKINPQIWFCNKNWYKNKGNFCIVRTDGNEEELAYNYNNIYNLRLDCTTLYGDRKEQIGNLTQENVIKALGEPQKTLSFENYSILIYDK